MRKPKQLEFKKVKGWGGKRRNAGRPNKTGTVHHMKREEVNFKRPLHITLKLKSGLKNLRVPPLLEQFKISAEKAKQQGLRLIHFSIQTNHLHLLVECRDNETLSRGMKSLGCKLGKAIRKYCGGSGPVFKGRFHLQVIKNPTQARNSLAYVLLNEAKHKKFIPYKDAYSSAGHFHEWRRLLGRNTGPILQYGRQVKRSLPGHLSAPHSWLAREGWKRAARDKPAFAR